MRSPTASEHGQALWTVLFKETARRARGKQLTDEQMRKLVHEVQAEMERLPAEELANLMARELGRAQQAERAQRVPSRYSYAIAYAIPVVGFVAMGMVGVFPWPVVLIGLLGVAFTAGLNAIF